MEDDRHGLFGGYLVLNEAGRPLEFHCTAPIRPSRPQEILYGNTLRPYLYGEQIGQALLSKAKHPPSIILTDQRPALALQTLIEIPVTLILPTKNEEPATIALESDPYEILGPPLADSPENENLNRQMDPGTAGEQLPIEIQPVKPGMNGKLNRPRTEANDSQRSVWASITLLSPIRQNIFARK